MHSDTAAASRIWDAIVIGGGHNGLVAAAYLAKAGRDVLLLERRPIVGGACVTEEIVPGFKFSRAAYVNSLFRPTIIRDLRLKEHGFRMLPRNPSSFTPLLDGRSLLLGRSAAQNHESIARFSKRDADAFPEYEQLLTRLADFVEPLLDQPPIDPLARGTSWVSTLWPLTKATWRALRLGRDLYSLLEVMSSPARKILDRWFESEPLRATLATDAIIGAMVSPSVPGSGYVLFHHVMGETDGNRGVWGYVEGGMGRLSEAIRSAAEAHGAQVRTNAEVAEITVRGGRAAGVVLADGTELRARKVLSGADPYTTFIRLLPAEHLPDDFRGRLASLDLSSGVTKINVAIDRLPDFTALPGSTPGPQHRGTIHLCQSVEEIEAGYVEALAGQPSSRPIVEMTIPSSLDTTLAPPGQHVASLFVQYTPYKLTEGSWDDPGRKDAFADRVFSVVEEFAPGFTESIIERDVLSPLDLERVFNLTGGNIFHGAMSLDQLYFLRPAPGWSHYHTPIRGLYLCGSGAHPGGGVLGAPGRNAALIALRAADA